jgi:hypothetical protein
MNILSVATDSSGLLYVGAATDQGGEIIIYPVNPPTPLRSRER